MKEVLVFCSRVGVRAMTKKDGGVISKFLISGAVVAVVLSAIGYLGTDIWLASTQWLLVACVLSLFSVYLKI